MTVRRVRRRVVAPALAMTIAALLAACGGDNSSGGAATTAAGGAATTAAGGAATTAAGGAATTAAAGGASTTQAANITKGGNLTVIQTTDTGSFDPTKQGTLSGQGNVDGPVYDSFIYLDNKTGEPKPLVVDLTGSTDAKTWTFKIVKPDIKFSDGTPFNSEAIKATFDYHAKSATSQGKGLAAAITSWDTSDPMVAVATLSAPNSVFPIETVTRIGYPLSPTALAKYGENYGTSPETTVGLGPFTVQSYVRNSQIVYAKNPNYWQAGKPYLDSVTVKFFPDPNTAFQTLQTGGADAMQPSSQTIDDQAKAAGLPSVPYYYNAVTFHPIYFINLQKAPFNDPVARQALYACLDPQKVAASSGRPVAAAIYDKSSPWYSDNGTFPAYDATKCQDLINQWSAKNNGATMEFTVTDITGNSALGGQGETIQAVFSNYQKVKVNVQQVTLQQVATIPATGNWDLYPSAVGGVDPTQAYQSAYVTNGSRNFGKYSSPEMDAALLDGVSTTDKAQRKKDYDTVQRLLMTDLPTWFMPIVGFAADHYVVSKKLQNWDGGQWTGPLVSQIYLGSGS
jgi:peptide/nickel transport system substrate-binding protein